MLRYLTLFSFLGLVACGSDSTENDGACSATTATNTTAVSLKNLKFNPECFAVNRGDTVTFTNNDSATHDVSTEAGQSENFTSPNLAGGATFQHTFSTAGTFKLLCDFHSAMSATIIVK